MTEHAGRNDPCPCGSGRKYKNCCMGKRRFTERTVAGVRLWMLAALGVAAVGIVVGVRFLQNPPGTRATGARAGLPPAAAGPSGQPWAYDSLRNQHWDPNHGHWHEGPPPPPEQRSQSAAAPIAPAPYAYDSVSNRHWDPNHGHWHQGPPPAGAR